jgi:hypothetical protein
MGSSSIHRRFIGVISWRHDDAAGYTASADGSRGAASHAQKGGGELTGTTIEKFRWMVRDGREGRSFALLSVR